MKSIKPVNKKNRLVSLDEAIRRAKAAEKQEKPKKIPAEEKVENLVCPYKHLEIEAYSSEKMMSFDKSLERIKANGFERHLTPQEYFSVLMDFLDGTIDHEMDGLLYALASDMLNSEGCWLHTFWEKWGRKLKCYGRWRHDVVFDGKEYSLNDADSVSGIFTLKDDQIGTEVFLHEISKPNFAKYFFGRSYERWPEEMKEGEFVPCTWMPKNNFFSPISYSRKSLRNAVPTSRGRIKIVFSPLAYSRGVRIAR